MTVTKHRGRATVVALTLLLTAGVGGGTAVLTAEPAGAEISGVSPPVRDVEPGGSTSATVTVNAGESFTCISGTPSRADLQPSFSTTCSDAGKWTSTLTVQVPNEPGTYSVRVRDDNFGGREGTFTIRVRAPAPPTTTTTTMPTTTTTVAPTTTTTTLAATTTTAVPETTTTSTTEPGPRTTSLPTPAPGDPFTPVAELLQDPLPAEGIFLPLTDTDFRSCLPLTSACSDDGTGLVLVPARTSEIAWHPIDASELPGDNSDLRGLESIPAVGVGPAAPREQNYALTMLDLSTSVIGLRTLVRSVDAKGELTVALGSAPLFGAVAAGPDTTVQGGATPTPNPFGRPTIVRGSTLSEAAPVIPMYAAPTPQVLHALRADVTWGVNVEVIPLVGASLPFLARAVDGTPGLYVARPPGLRLAVAGAATTAPASDDDDDDGGGGGGGGPATPLVLLGSVAVLVAGALGVALLRRRRTGDDEDDLDVGSAQDGARLAAAAAAAVDDVAPAPIAAVAAVQPDDDDVEDEDDLDGGRALAAADADADVDAADDDDAAYDEIQQSAQDELAALVAAASAAAGNTDDMYDDDGVVTYDVEIDDEPHDTGRPTDPVRYVELTADPAFNRGSTVERDDILPGFEDDDED